VSAILFAGPSTHGVGTDELGGLSLRPPAGCGDLLRALHEGATAIGLVDGIFETGPSVWHKEILAVLDKGIPVLGAASMGALRAAECHPFGMVGVGGIFAEYRDGLRTADADVAVLHAPAELGFRPLTVALVDAEATLAKMARLGLVDAFEEAALCEAARALHFKDRDWPRIAAGAGLSEERAKRIAGGARGLAASRKREDARALAARLRELGSKAGDRKSLLPRPFNRTLFLAALEKRIGRTECSAGRETIGRG